LTRRLRRGDRALWARRRGRSRNPVHNALSLVATLFGVAVLFIAQERLLPRRGAGHRLRRRHRGAVPVRDHAARRRPGRVLRSSERQPARSRPAAARCRRRRASLVAALPASGIDGAITGERPAGRTARSAANDLNQLGRGAVHRLRVRLRDHLAAAGDRRRRRRGAGRKPPPVTRSTSTSSRRSSPTTRCRWRWSRDLATTPTSRSARSCSASVRWPADPPQPAGDVHVHRADAQRRQPHVRGVLPGADDIGGQVVVFFVLVVAAAEVVVGLGIIVAIMRRRPAPTPTTSR
jgi:hypothetical protein